MHSLPALMSIAAPLVASGLVVLLGASLGERASKIALTALTISAGAALMALYQTVQHDPTLLQLPGFPHPFTPILLFDRLAAVMMVLITGVSLIIHVYSRRYMQGEPGYVRFFALLSLLTFLLLSLVTSGNLFWMFLCWHAVTWVLKALLSFDQTRPAARQAGRTGWWVLGLGDAALVIATILIFTTFGTLNVTDLFQAVKDPSRVPIFGQGSWWEVDAITVVTLVLVITIMTKSAQFHFNIWLPGTIEAPTPVSAVLHAGIVNAGGFLVNRLAPFYGMAPTTLHVLFLVGALTALIGAATMLVQSSIKRTLVYSTMGQMGYMVMECGLGAFALAIFHLCAHGLFKATLFLNSGANIHRARLDFNVPGHRVTREAGVFSFMTWATGLVITLLLPLVILLIAHGLVNVELFETQGTVIFLFFAWVTSAQAIFSLYRLSAVASWKVSATMIGTLGLIGMTYLWAAESFTHFLYPAHGQAAAFFKAAAWPQGLFDTFVVVSALLVVAVWVFLYGKAHGARLLLPNWLNRVYRRIYVAFLNGLYVENAVRALASGPLRGWGWRHQGRVSRPVDAFGADGRKGPF